MTSDQIDRLTLAIERLSNIGSFGDEADWPPRGAEAITMAICGGDPRRSSSVVEALRSLTSEVTGALEALTSEVTALREVIEEHGEG